MTGDLGPGIQRGLGSDDLMVLSSLGMMD
jgi:hypothetical protein